MILRADSLSNLTQKQDIGPWPSSACAKRDKRGGSAIAICGNPSLRVAGLAGSPAPPCNHLKVTMPLGTGRISGEIPGGRGGTCIALPPLGRGYPKIANALPAVLP